MGEISMSGSTREREAAVIGLGAFHPVLSSLLYWFNKVLNGAARPGALPPGTPHPPHTAQRLVALATSQKRPSQ